MFKRILLIAALALGAATWCSGAPAKGKTTWTTKSGAYSIVAKTSCPRAVAKVGEEVKLSVVTTSKKPGFVRATCYVNGLEKGKPQIVEFGKAAEFTVTPKAPGSVSLICTMLNENKKPVLDGRKRQINMGIGVIVAPSKIAPGNPKCPDDFDEFWKARRAELDQVPVKATSEEVQLTESEAKNYPQVVCRDVKVDCAGGAPVSGYLCMPRDAQPKSLPAIVIYHGAGVRSAQKRLRYGTKAIAFDVNAHGIKNGQPKKYYDDLQKGDLKSYFHRGFDDHNHIYFVGMYMRVMRALDYVKSLPEWDGKTLIVTGGSQGGAQTVAAAALDPQITLAVAGVPAVCDLGGQLAKRRPGWPIHFLNPVAKRSDPALLKELAYIDGVFFAQRIKCPIYFSTGGIDNTCHATAVYSAYNSTPGKNKNIHFNPVGHHGSSPNPQGLKKIDETIGLTK